MTIISKQLGYQARQDALNAGERARMKAKKKVSRATWIEFVCDGCSMKFKRMKSDVNKQAKRGYKIRFCSWYCPRKGK